MSVASVHADFEAILVSLRARFYLPAGTEASVVVFTDTEPLVDTDDTHVLEPPMVYSATGLSIRILRKHWNKNFPSFRTCCCTYNSNMACSRWVRLVANRQSVYAWCYYTRTSYTRSLPTASVTDTPEFRISAISASPKNKELAVAREALEAALAKHLLTPPSLPNKFRRS